MINLSAGINTMPIPDSVKHALETKGFRALEELVAETEDNLAKIAGVGKSFAKTIRVYFKRHGVALGAAQAKAPAAAEESSSPPTIAEETRRLLPATPARTIQVLEEIFGGRNDTLRAMVRKHPSVTITTGAGREATVLVPRGRQQDLARVMGWVSERSFSEGVMSLADVIRRLDLNHNWCVNMDNITALLGEIFDLVWLDRDYGWFWIRDTASPMAHQALMALSLARTMSARAMRRALERWYRAYVQDTPMPLSQAAILGLCRALPEYCFVDGDTIYASNDLKPIQVINVMPERGILKAFVDSGEEEMSYSEIERVCSRMHEGKFMLKPALEGSAFVEKIKGKYRLLRKTDREPEADRQNQEGSRR